MTKVYVGKDQIGMEIQVAINQNAVFHRVQGINKVSQSITFSKWEQYEFVEVQGDIAIYTDMRSCLVYELKLDETIKVRLPKTLKVIDESKNKEFDEYMKKFFN